MTYFTSTNRRSDTPQFDKAGLITAGSQLEIKAETIDNCFVIINGISGLHIEAETLINNGCGLMISTGKTKIKGRVQFDPELNTCNIFRLKSGSIPNYFIKRNRNDYGDNKSSSIIATYQGSNNNGQGAPITMYPGYIFSKDDLSIDI